MFVQGEDHPGGTIMDASTEFCDYRAAAPKRGKQYGVQGEAGIMAAMLVLH